MPSPLIIFSALHSGGKIFDVDDQKVEHCPPTPLNGNWGFAEVYQSWIGLPDDILGLSFSSFPVPGWPFRPL